MATHTKTVSITDDDQKLLSNETINIDYLTTHTFPLEDSKEAYKLILEKKENYLGILISYSKEVEVMVAEYC